VSQQFISSGNDDAIRELDNHEQRHSDIASLTCALGNVFVDVAVAAKTDVARARARNVAVTKVFPSVQTVITALNTQYDQETHHGEHKSVQEEWDDTLAEKVLAAWRSEGGPAFEVER
jgi:hypothetical protein